MKRVFDFIGLTVGGWLGWIALAWMGIFAAFIGGIVGTGVGLYAARRVGKRLLP